MLLAFAIAAVQQLTFISYLLETTFFTRTASDDSHALMVGIALLSAFLSIPSFFWNFIMVKESNEKRDIVSTVVTLATFTFGAGFLIIDFVYRIHAMGLRIF